ncbi:Rho termination factor N-terminal domain-containing protein [Rhodococcus rhodnii]|uniref:Rho termination factor-like N-terminal domain-containing protein n=1 Tax=Rhodococcus rhodnii LMG 5362 TaxID=1273125 RepID=R7WIM8_9NOCA|nr:Rho termination factor N-terminal domain-containing protein [Rhodococcus rhodnii]EOM75061.1 hypothetical protein Rrhod_3674 [Rhodococcus rhodnii LMG 5362]
MAKKTASKKPTKKELGERIARLEADVERLTTEAVTAVRKAEKKARKAIEQNTSLRARVDELEQAAPGSPIPQSAPAGEDLESLTAAELRSRAKAAGVPGYSRMPKAALVEALGS